MPVPGSNLEVFHSRTVTPHELLGRIGQHMPDKASRLLAVPDFQRPYRWEEEHVTDFVDDIIAFYKELYRGARTSGKSQHPVYFLGPIVLMPEPQNNRTTILDGQQRLTTISLALAALRDLAFEFYENFAEQIRDSLRDVARDIERDHLFLEEIDPDNPRPALRLNLEDNLFYFNRFILRNNSSREPPKAERESHKRLLNAYQKLREKFKEILTPFSSPSDLLQEIRYLRDLLTRGLVLVEITVREEADAYTVFQTLNNRGLRLSAEDLIRLLLISRSPEDQRQNVAFKWAELTSSLEDDDVDIEVFLRHQRISRIGDIKRNSLVKEYENELAKTAVLNFLSELSDDAERYLSLLNAASEGFGEAAIPLQRLLNLGGENRVRPFLLAATRKFGGNTREFRELVEELLRLSIGYLILAKKDSARFEWKLFSLAPKIQEGAGIQEIIGELKTAFSVSLRELIQAMEGQNPLKKNQAKILLEILSEEDVSSQVLRRASLEHIAPREDRERCYPPDVKGYIWHLGNLTLLEKDKNKLAQSRCFEYKRKIYADSQFPITRELSELEGWSRKEIIERAKNLVRKLGEKLGLPD